MQTISKKDDIYWLFSELKKENLAEIKVVDSKESSMIVGKMLLLNNSEITFYIKFNKSSFLRIQIRSTRNPEISKKGLTKLTSMLSVIEYDGKKAIGNPTVFYVLSDDKQEYLTSDWYFINPKKCIMDIQNETYFSDNCKCKKIHIFNHELRDEIEKETKEEKRKKIREATDQVSAWLTDDPSIHIMYDPDIDDRGSIKFKSARQILEELGLGNPNIEKNYSSREGISRIKKRDENEEC